MKEVLGVISGLLYSLGLVVLPVTIPLLKPVDGHELKLPYHEFQTFNNCGPSSLAMIMQWYGTRVSGRELGQKIRPYQHPKGNNDDKTVFAEEFVSWAQKYGYGGVERVGGDIELLKRLLANNFPVVVKTLLKEGDDIAHFRIITGWDEGSGVLVQSDSYDHKRSTITYKEFLQTWRPFNYVYIVIYKPEQEELVKKTLGEDWEKKKNLEITLQEATLEGDLFNQITSLVNLGRFEEAVVLYEQVESKLPRRTLWYQIEPIQAYKETKRYDKFFRLTDKILNDGNRAFSELYYLRGQVYEELGDVQKAKEEFDLARKYNVNRDFGR